MAKRQLKLGAFMRPVSIHTGAWRYPGAWPDANFNFPRIKKLIQNLDAALNFGRDDHMEHAERYKRAREFYDVVTGLWDSFADDAFARDVDAGLYFDPAKMHVLNHKGKYLSVRGPLNIARPVQGWP